MTEENRSYYYSQAAKNPIIGNDGFQEVNLVSNAQATTQQPVFARSQPEQPVAAPAPHQWRDSIFDWPTNLYPSCFCVCCNCYGMYLIAQMTQKTGYQSFSSTLGAFIIVWVVSIIIQFIFGGPIIIILPIIYSLCASIALRLHIVQKYNINDFNSCQFLGECCLGFWCWYCSVAQMARHVYGYSKIIDGDGDPDRPDNYAQSPPTRSEADNTYTFRNAVEVV
mmetsp:Transcript_13815/g.18892  ORF Transcript_13815/g.18892 Transcript_13815/m.18892 type:complete len:223 (+) Transcript_13815:22-690(+)